MAKLKSLPVKNVRLPVTVDFRVVSSVLFIVILTMLLLWQPWTGSNIEKAISVTGEAVIEETPDEYRFSPSFSSTGTSTADATQKVTAVGEQVVAQLRALGVAEQDLKTDVYAYEEFDYRGATPEMTPASKTYKATFNLTCKVRDRALAEKITNYLATSGAEGSITPAVTFSEELRKRIDLQAREQAIADAKEKAEVQARESGLKLGKVVSIDELQGIGEIIPLEASATTDSRSVLYPGQQELRVKLAVKFEIK